MRYEWFEVMEQYKGFEVPEGLQVRFQLDLGEGRLDLRVESCCAVQVSEVCMEPPNGEPLESCAAQLGILCEYVQAETERIHAEREPLREKAIEAALRAFPGLTREELLEAFDEPTPQAAFAKLREILGGEPGAPFGAEDAVKKSMRNVRKTGQARQRP